MNKIANKKELILKSALNIFSKKGYYATTMPELAKELDMSPGNIYRYFDSKEELAYETLLYSSKTISDEIDKINAMPLHSKEKIWHIVNIFLNFAKHSPEHINFFIKVTVASKEIFKGKKSFSDSKVVKSLHAFYEESVLKRELRNQDFFGVFGLFMGYLSGIAYMYGQDLLEEDILRYTNTISQNIYEALKVREKEAI
ncbi:MAG: TetR/AcrR family transcriptional regulator [Sulfurospirillaceae bacterium]|nr:TetR/AcrR family transcriptional regulator [Sulfurospirillaceae bacterium]MCK9546670.1 TetR/AcrR family transcriptional regulator [Sulfurospirillaceae bacterium]MDY0237752.1 TetR/AcrR family transcriptional regulator [Campylobacterales bacterium]NLM99607.1 TetR/AcrR family transcriptional regulator [Campylobacteraceae bacterium]